MAQHSLQRELRHDDFSCGDQTCIDGRLNKKTIKEKY